MTKCIIIICSLFFAASAGAQAFPSSQAIPVLPDSEAKDLAQGFAGAATSLKRRPVSLILQKEGIVRVIEDIRSIRNSEGILVIEISKGITFLINPRDVLYFTDGPEIKPKK